MVKVIKRGSTTTAKHYHVFLQFSACPVFDDLYDKRQILYICHSLQIFGPQCVGITCILRYNMHVIPSSYLLIRERTVEHEER